MMPIVRRRSMSNHKVIFLTSSSDSPVNLAIFSMFMPSARQFLANFLVKQKDGYNLKLINHS